MIILLWVVGSRGLSLQSCSRTFTYCYVLFSFSLQRDQAAVYHYLGKFVIISASWVFGTRRGLALISKGPGALHKLSVCPASKEQPPLGQRPAFRWDAGSACILAWADASECFNDIRFTSTTAALWNKEICLLFHRWGRTEAQGD